MRWIIVSYLLVLQYGFRFGCLSLVERKELGNVPRPIRRQISGLLFFQVTDLHGFRTADFSEQAYPRSPGGASQTALLAEGAAICAAVPAVQPNDLGKAQYYQFEACRFLMIAVFFEPTVVSYRVLINMRITIAF